MGEHTSPGGSATPFAELWNGPRFRVNRALAAHGIPPHKSCADCAEQTRHFFAPRELVQPRRKVKTR